MRYGEKQGGETQSPLVEAFAQKYFLALKIKNLG